MSKKEAQAEARESSAKGQCFCMGTGPELYEMLRSMGPDSARDYFRNARVEILKGMRELINHRIDRLSRSHQKGTKVAVD